MHSERDYELLASPVRIGDFAVYVALHGTGWRRCYAYARGRAPRWGHDVAGGAAARMMPGFSKALSRCGATAWYSGLSNAVRTASPLGNSMIAMCENSPFLNMKPFPSLEVFRCL